MTQKATFGAGCFWGVEETFRRIDGVVATSVGFMGGDDGATSYEQVCSGRSGHAEVVDLEFDPDRVGYDQLLDVFFSHHDPTTLNRQGPDSGTQYRSAIFFHTPEQDAVACAAIQRLSVAARFPGPIVTTIEPAVEFHRAEEYHQRYLEKRGQSSCSI